MNIYICTISVYERVCHFSILGDEILAVNGLALQGMTHSESISAFKNIRVGKVVLHLARRDAATRR